MNRMTFLIVVALAIGAAPADSWSQSDKEQLDTPLTAEKQKSVLGKLRDIFASVDKLPARDARWVEVQAGPAEEKTWYRGWLLRESEAEIRLLMADGRRKTFHKKKRDAKKPATESDWSDAWAVRDGDFAKHCRDFLTEKKKARDDSNEIGVYRFQLELMEANASVVDAARLASWASVTGNEVLAGQLLKRALHKLQERRSTYVGLPEGDQLHQFVAGQTSPDLEVSLETPLGEPEPDPRELRLRSLEWNKALAKIPYRPDHDTIVRRIKQLKSLIAEDRAWKEPTREELARMDDKQKAAYWLHHLRDLHVTQNMSPGMCRVLTDSPFAFIHSLDRAKEGSPNPAVELKKLGYKILPQIIAHLEDDRPTRCVGFWRPYVADSYYTLTYGDCCQQIFEAIALHSIYERKTTNGYPLRDGKGKQCKERAEKWWKEFQKKGEKQVLIEGTKRGDRDSSSNAERLVKKFPEAAFEPLCEGIRAARERWIRSNLISFLREVQDGRVVAVLHEQTRGPHLDVRVNALEGLLERNQEEAVDLLVAEWKRLDPDKVDPDDPWGTEHLQDALVRCGREKAVAALAARWKTIPLERRHDIVERLGEANKDFANRPFTPAAIRAVETLLISCLSEREEGRRGLRTCDLAANALAVRWGDPKLFDLSEPLSARDRRIIEVENIWRKKQGMKLLPVPESRRMPSVRKAVASMPEDHRAPQDSRFAMPRHEEWAIGLLRRRV